uniref:NADH-ubiquinone oxidoreductase chain 2 n=1 Tax=Aquatica ficta TaxID=1631555 RepID=A0A1Y0BT43_9COLE|nr:NADH dehydrogenase subunit 2 [Aquatica ficta]ART65558.1 NADH dehydrogenase subunit 2 [Aquatica ficta]
MVKMYKLTFLSTLIMSTLISISAYTWLGMWIGLEMNLLSIIPIISSKNMMSSESSIKYFITQAIASTVILMSIIMMMWKYNIYSTMDNSNLLMIMNSGLFLKMGMAPLHFWFPEVLEGLNWNNCMLMLTWQKITPMMLIMYNTEFTMFYSVIIISGMIISSIMSMNQVSIRKLMAFSSINHMGWMLAAMIMEKTIWIIYFMIYSFITINIAYMMKNTYYLSQLFPYLNTSPMMKMFFMLNFLSLSGIPPFLGFLPKWMVIQTMVMNKMFMLSMIMIAFTLIMIYIYMRIMMTALVMKINQSNWTLKLNTKINSLSIGMLNFFLVMSLILVTIMLNMI